MPLATFQSDDRVLSQMQTQWAAELNPLLALPVCQSRILKSVPLAIGSNTINHLLGAPLRGWVIVRQRAAARVYDTQDSNTMPDLTLKLTSDAVVVVDILVF